MYCSNAVAVLTSLVALASARLALAAPAADEPQYDDTRQLMERVTAAAQLLSSKGEAALKDFRVPNSRWRHGNAYVFVLDPRGLMLVHPDPSLEGKNVLQLKDVDGRPIIRGLLDTVTTTPGKIEGWYHYQWPVPGGLLPRWKSSYVRLVVTPSGERYVIGSGVYNDRMERGFVVDLVKDAVALIERNGRAAFPRFYDPTGQFLVKSSYVFVFDKNGVDLVNPAFRNLEGRNLLDRKDTHGKPLIREMLRVVETRGSGWVDYMWPKPGESVSTQKSAYVQKAKMGDDWVLVGCGVYLAEAPKEALGAMKPTAPELMSLVREGAAVLAKSGEAAYPEFRRKGSKWFRDDTYFFVWTMDGTRVFHAANPSGEGEKVAGLRDVLGKPFGQMILDVAASPSGEGWVHYMYPKPDDIFPTWKSTFVKRVTFPSGTPHIIGCGIYNMQLNKLFIENVVDQAATIVAAQGRSAFAQLRDKTGPFVFMDTYVFVDSSDGTELVNAAQPSLEGKNLLGLRDVRGKQVTREYIDAALKNGSAWVSYDWYKPGRNTPSRKQTYVRKVQSGKEIFVVGSGLYLD